MVEHKMFITFLQGIALVLITTCKAQVTLEESDSNGFQFNVNAPLLRKIVMQSLESMKFDDNWKKGASYLQDEIIKNFGQINDTNMKVNVKFSKPVENSKEIFHPSRPHHPSQTRHPSQPHHPSQQHNPSQPYHPSQPSASDTETASLTEAISEIDDELKKYRNTICGSDPPKPDFESKGHHRTSQARCLDYIWDIKLEEERRKKMCRGYDDLITPFIINGNKVHAGDYPHMNNDSLYLELTPNDLSVIAGLDNTRPFDDSEVIRVLQRLTGAIGWPAKEDGWIFLCGSSLISEKFVLTVAHCHSASEIDKKKVADRKPKIVRFGVVNIKTGRHPVDIKIRRFINHPKYNYTLRYHDIALIELENVVRFTENIRPACLWNQFSFQNMKTAAVTGWGVSDPFSNQQTISPNLQVTRLDIIDYKKCRDNLIMKESTDWWGLARHQMCAGKMDGNTSACEGDSGGPLQIKLPTDTTKSVHSIIGITSVGFGCGMTKFPSLYTRVSSFIEWIEKEVWEDQEDIENKLTQYFGSHQTHHRHRHRRLGHEKHTSRYYSPKIGTKYTSRRHEDKHRYHPHSNNH